MDRLGDSAKATGAEATAIAAKLRGVAVCVSCELISGHGFDTHLEKKSAGHVDSSISKYQIFLRHLEVAQLYLL